MGAAREKDQADFDLERFIDLFDEALTSKDPRVIDILRSLMMIVALTCPESQNSGRHDCNTGPLRRLYEDVNHLNRRLHDLEGEFRNRHYREAEKVWNDNGKYPEEKFMLKAQNHIAAQMAQSIDDQVMKQAGFNVASRINKGLINK